MRRSIERARAQAHSIVNRSVNQLRRLREVAGALNDHEHGKHLYLKSRELEISRANLSTDELPPTEAADNLASICDDPRNARCGSGWPRPVPAAAHAPVSAA